MGESTQNAIVATIAWIILVVVVIGSFVGIFFLYQGGKVYGAEQSGKARLAEATFSKQVQLEEAKANLESQKLNAQAEVERAKGASQAIAQERGSFTNDEYIRYLYVRDIKDVKAERIYVPTEAGIPIIERATK